MVNLINTRGRVISVVENDAKKLLAAGSHQRAPEGVTTGYLPEFDTSLPKAVAVPEKVELVPEVVVDAPAQKPAIKRKR
jgi:hypothetical protein